MSTMMMLSHPIDPPHYIYNTNTYRMQKDSLEETFPEDLTYHSLIEQVIIVSLAPNTRIKSDSHCT